MKKVTLLFALIIGAVMAFGQTENGFMKTWTNPGPPVREENPGFDCYPNYLYSQLVPYTEGTITSYGSLYNVGNNGVYDNILSTPAKPVDEVTFWGTNDGPSVRSFKIAFYTNIDGMPGDLIASYISELTGENLNYWAQIERYHAILPSKVNLQAGDFISIGADYGQGTWYWVFSNDGDHLAYRTNFETTQTLQSDVAFCLGHTVLIPLSPWAIFLGFGLILMFVLYRARRY